jgi:hypothetical protein
VKITYDRSVDAAYIYLKERPTQVPPYASQRTSPWTLALERRSSNEILSPRSTWGSTRKAGRSSLVDVSAA